MVYEFTFKVTEEGADVTATLAEAVDSLRHALNRWQHRCERADKDAHIPDPQYLTAAYEMENCPACMTLHRIVDPCPKGCSAGTGYVPLNPVVAEAMAEQAIDARIAEANERTEDEPEEDEPEAEDEPFTDHPEIPPCPACTNGFGVLLGQLGNLVHFRCRNCGMTFNIQAGE